MCLLFGTLPQKESKIKIEDRVGNLIETPKSEGKGKTKCPRGRGSGSAYIRFRIRHQVLVISHIHQIATKFNVYIKICVTTDVQIMAKLGFRRSRIALKTNVPQKKK